MIDFTENKHELVIRNFPLYSLMLAGLFFLMGIVLTVTMFDYIYRPLFSGSPVDSVATLCILINAAMLLGGIFWALSAPIITTTINSQTKTLTIDKKSVLTHNFREFNFFEIENQITVKTTYNKGSSLYMPQITVTSTGEMIDLLSNYETKSSKVYDLTDCANKYLADESDRDNFKLTILNDD